MELDVLTLRDVESAGRQGRVVIDALSMVGQAPYLLSIVLVRQSKRCAVFCGVAVPLVSRSAV